MSLLFFLTGHLCLLSFFFLVSLAKYLSVSPRCIWVVGQWGACRCVCVDGRCFRPEYHIHYSLRSYVLTQAYLLEGIGICCLASWNDSYLTMSIWDRSRELLFFSQPLELLIARPFEIKTMMPLIKSRTQKAHHNCHKARDWTLQWRTSTSLQWCLQ